MTSPSSPTGGIAGSVLPIRRAEELIATLQGVLSVRIVPSDTGSIEEVHVLTTDAVLPKQTVRNIESALMAQLGLRVNHRKISIATTLDTPRALDPAPPPSRTGSLGAYVPPAESSSSAGQASGPAVGSPSGASGRTSSGSVAGAEPGQVSANAPTSAPLQAPSHAPSLGPSGAPTGARVSEESLVAVATPVMGRRAVPVDVPNAGRRALIFEDVEVRRSRARGVTCKVTLGRDGEEFIGEAEGQETERSRIELAARATLLAMVQAMRVPGGAERSLALEGSKLIDAFEREFIFVSISARIGRESVLLTGSCEVRESAETSAVLAVLDATNRWMHLDR